MKKSCSKTLIKEFKAVIDEYPIVKCIHKRGTKNPFFLFKKSGDIWFESPPDYNYNDGACNVNVTAFYDCKVFFRDKFHEGLISKYGLDEDSIPEILIKNIIENKKLVVSKEYVTPIKNLFRKFGLIIESRGVLKKKTLIDKKRDAFIIKKYKFLGSPKRIPIKELNEAWEKKALLIFPEINKHYVHDDTIRRIIKKHLKSRIIK